MRNSIRRLCDTGIAGEYQLLHFQGTTNRVDDAAEFGKSAVTGVFDDPAAMLADFRLDDLAPMAQQAEMGAFLVRGHQP